MGQGKARWCPVVDIGKHLPDLISQMGDPGFTLQDEVKNFSSTPIGTMASDVTPDAKNGVKFHTPFHEINLPWPTLQWLF